METILRTEVGNQPDSSKLPRKTKAWAWTKTRSARKMFALCRWVHVYLSATALVLLIFFCVTGIFLNHLDWFESEGPHRVITQPIPHHLLQSMSGEADPSLDGLKRYIKEEWGLTHARKIDLDAELGEITFDFPLPAGYALVSISLSEGEMELERQEGTVLALLNDLHKGRHSGWQWSWLLDCSAVLIMVLSLTGLVLLLQQTRWRFWGLALVGLGFMVPLLVYLAWVPR